MPREPRRAPVYYTDAEGNKTQIGTVDVNNYSKKPDGFYVTLKLDDIGNELEFTVSNGEKLRNLFSIPEDEYSIGVAHVDVETSGFGKEIRPAYPGGPGYGFSMGDWAREVERRSALDSGDSEDSQS